MKLVMTGTGRSGTKYLSELFSSLGVPSGHELVYTPWGVNEFSLPGEASYAAAAYPDFVPDDSVIFHVHRDPLKTLRSHLSWHYDPKTRRGFWDADTRHKDFGVYHKFWKKQLPGVYNNRDAMGRAICFVSFWSTKTFRTFNKRKYYKIGRLERLDPEHVKRILDLMEVESSIEDIELAIEDSDKTLNSRPEFFDHLTWETVMAHPMGHLLEDIKTTFALGEE